MIWRLVVTVVALFALAGLASVRGDQVKWTVRPYGYNVWAVSKTYGDSAEWSHTPTDTTPNIEEVIACKDIPSEKMANVIANALNQ